MGGPRGRTGVSRFSIRRGDISESALLVDDTEPVFCGCGFGFHPMPDSRRIDDLMGSGEFERRRSRKGDLRLDIVQRSDHREKGGRETSGTTRRSVVTLAGRR